MGLTIHYTLTTKLDQLKDIRRLVQTMREWALELPFQEVSAIKEFQEAEADHHDTADEDRWLKIQAAGSIMDGQVHLRVPPQCILAFSTWPGEGCEQANFGFCNYPAFITTPTPTGRQRRLATKLDGWRWSSFCKTQYASDPRCGGVPNFLRCHLCVVKMLDFLHQSGLVEVEVKDEGGYWEGRNLEKLAREVGDWNEHIAGLVSMFRSSAGAEGKTTDAPITQFANFEHLEAKGLEKLAELRRRFGQAGEAN